MSAEINKKIPYEVFTFYPDVVRVVSVKILKKYVRPGVDSNVIYEDIVSDCYLYYLEALHKYKALLETYEERRQFAYLHKAIRSQFFSGLHRNIRIGKAERGQIEYAIASEEELYEPETLTEQEKDKQIHTLAEHILGEELDTDNVSRFVKLLEGEGSHFSYAILEAMQDTIESVRDNIRTNAHNYEISKDGEIRAKANRGIYKNGWKAEQNPDSVRGHIRRAITEDGLYDIKDIRDYLNRKGVFFNDGRNNLDSQISRAFKSLGMKRPMSKRLQRTAKLNVYIKDCLNKGMSRERIVSRLRETIGSFNLDSSFDIKAQVKRSYHSWRRKIKRQEEAKAERIVHQPKPKLEKANIGICVSVDEFWRIREMSLNNSVPFKSLVRGIATKIIPPEEALEVFREKLASYSREVRRVPYLVNMEENKHIDKALSHFTYLKKQVKDIKGNSSCVQ